MHGDLQIEPKALVLIEVTMVMLGKGLIIIMTLHSRWWKKDEDLLGTTSLSKRSGFANLIRELDPDIVDTFNLTIMVLSGVIIFVVMFLHFHS